MRDELVKLILLGGWDVPACFFQVLVVELIYTDTELLETIDDLVLEVPVM